MLATGSNDSHTYIHTYIHIYIHTYIHTHTISGDGNTNNGWTTFVDVVQAAMDSGWLVELWSWRNSLSKKLLNKVTHTYIHTYIHAYVFTFVHGRFIDTNTYTLLVFMLWQCIHTFTYIQHYITHIHTYIHTYVHTGD